MNKVCSFTGHRRLNPRHIAGLPALLQRAINYAYTQGCRSFASGGAIGFDMLAAREVLRYRISHPDVRLVMMLPCVDQDAKWSARDKDAYAYILSEADEVIYESEEYTENCLKKRNERLAAAADIMICYLARRGSGAGQTVAMAKKRGCEIYNLYFALES